MKTQVKRVELIVDNLPGVLGRVAGHIRHEGWNIKSLHVFEIDSGYNSEMTIDIEGVNDKLARVAERLLRLDCVVSVKIDQDGEIRVYNRKAKERCVQQSDKPILLSKTEKDEGAYRILTINPGSTSTKFAVYDDETAVLNHTVKHSREELSAFESVLKQKNFRKQHIINSLNEANIDISSIDAISGRGGLLKPIESGTYVVNEAMLQDLQSATASLHASALGAIIASEIAKDLNIDAYVVDPIVVDEMDRNAKLTGMPGIERSSVFHALNQKAVAKRLAADIGKPYENARFVVAHLGGGITIGAHRYGRVIDVNDALAGEGPFTPERSGGLPVIPIIEMCFSGEYTKEEMIDRVVKRGGLQAYLGVNDLRQVQRMINEGDEFAALTLDSMAYQVSKEIGAMIAVLEGRADAIILTGGLAFSNRFTGAIKERVDAMAPVYVFPGEDEMLALMSGVLRVLRGQEKTSEYE